MNGGRMIYKRWIEKDLEGCGRSVIEVLFREGMKPARPSTPAKVKCLLHYVSKSLPVNDFMKSGCKHSLYYFSVQLIRSISNNHLSCDLRVLETDMRI
jgi:hypothetical protein